MTHKKSQPSERLAKRIARSGLCSRRAAEKLIEEGKVSVDGIAVITPAYNVRADQIVSVSGKPIEDAKSTRLWLYHKPTGLVTTHSDEKGRATVFSTLPKALGRVISIGRLDLNSEGLLLLTNDGGLARHLELPTTGWIRKYRVRVFGRPSTETLKKLARGMTVDGMRYGPIDVIVESALGSNCWLQVSLKEGKNREIRKVFEAVGHTVSRLIRVSYGPFQLGKLAKSEVKEVPRAMLRQQLGKSYEID